MGALDPCVLCGLPVLELEGQYEALDSYYASEPDAALTIAGAVHTPCLVGSAHGLTWRRWRIDHFKTVRGYTLTAAENGWTTLVDRRRRSLMAFSDTGASIAVTHSGQGAVRCPGGATLPCDEESHIGLEDTAFVSSIQADLTTDKRTPLSRLIDRLAIRSKLQWPAVLDDGAIVHSEDLIDHWTKNSFSARLRYRKYLPAPLVALVESL